MSGQVLSDNSPKSHRARNIAAAVIIVVILSAVLLVAVNILLTGPIGTPFPHNIVNGLITVNPATFKVYPFSVPSDAFAFTVGGTFTVSGNESGIRVYIMNDTNFVNWQNGNAFSTHYDSGESTTGDVIASPPPGGTYFLVFDNTFSAASKNIDTDIFAMYRPSH